LKLILKGGYRLISLSPEAEQIVSIITNSETHPAILIRDLCGIAMVQLIRCGEKYVGLEWEQHREASYELVEKLTEVFNKECDIRDFSIASQLLATITLAAHSAHSAAEVAIADSLEDLMPAMIILGSKGGSSLG